MKILLAPQSFKGSLEAYEVAQAMRRGIERVLPSAETVLAPMADGGEGTVEAVVQACQGRIVATQVADPLGRPITAHWGLLPDGGTGVIEMAAASGLPLLASEERNPLVTTTFGTGQLVLSALEAGCRKLIIGIGGSATNDGGAGMAQALGARLLDAQGEPLPFGGAALAKLEHIDLSNLDPRLRECQTLVASDVTNPLCGPEGASAVYGPQKGATPEMAALLDQALSRFAEVVQKDLGIEAKNIPGAGAAGGLGAGLIAFLKATLRPGVDIVAEAIGLEGRMRGVDLVFTGEGCLDGQTACGKTPAGVALRAKKHGLQVIAIVGGMVGEYRQVYELGIDAVLSIVSRPMSLEEACQDVKELVADAAERAMRLLAVGKGLGR